MGLAGWEIILTNSSSGEVDLTYTNATGHYQFCGLEPGDYDLSQTLKPGWMEVDAPGPITLGCYNLTDQNFRIEKLLCISGYKFDECTGMGLAGWETILTNSNGEVARTATNATGYYEFCGLRFGNYTVCEVLKAGWKNVTAECMYVELECEDIVVNFENIPPLCISGHEFNHCTGAGLDGWTINLKDGSGNVLYTTTTDGTGYYEFCGLEPGWYTVCEDNIPEGWTSFRDDLDSPVMSLPGTSASTEDYETPKCIVVNLDYCEDATDNDFENIPTFCIHGTIYNNSTTVSGFPVKIENSDGSLVLSIPTDENGEYSFCSLKGGSYTVCVDKPGWTADEPCAIVYLDCMDEEHDFDVYMGRSNILPGIEQPAITLGESTRAVVQGERSGEPTAAIEPVMGGDEEEGRQTQL
jgi:serine-aspartate repeat-containing protein C/D/E